MNFLLNSDAAAGTNVSSALAIDTSLKIDIPIAKVPKETMSGLRTDVGGGSTRKGLENEMMKLGRACAPNFLLVTACGHHGFNIMIVSPCQKYFGGGSIQNINLIQLLCAC